VDSRRTLFAPITMEAGHVGWQCRTSADGRFVLDTWPGGQTKLTIGFGDKTHGPRVALLDRFVPKGTEDVFEVELPDCAIEGEVEFQDAAPDGGRGLSEGLYEYLMGNLLGYSSAALVFAEWILFAIPEGKDFVPHLLQEEGWVTAGRLKQGPLRFRLEGMPPGTYSLRVMSVAPYHTTTVGPIEVREGQTPLGIWILVPQDPARNQSVEVWVPGGSSDGVGSRSWSLLLDPLISHILRMSGRSGLTRGRHIGIDEGQIFEVEIPTPETTHVIPAKGRGHLLVTVVDEVGEPVEGAAVSAFHRSGLDLLQFLMLTERNTDARGQLWIDSIPAETYTLQARWTNRRSNRVLIAVKAKEAQEVRLILEDGP